MIYWSTENVALYKYYPKENQEWVKHKDAIKLEAENAELKALIGYCITDMYKPSGKISKPTAIKLMKYMSDNNLLKH